MPQLFARKSAAKKALLTHSCTAALEMAAILAGIEAGDEVIMPSYTFVSTANSFVLRGGVPVFVDVKPETKNIDENLIEAAITSKKAGWMKRLLSFTTTSSVAKLRLLMSICICKMS